VSLSEAQSFLRRGDYRAAAAAAQAACAAEPEARDPLYLLAVARRYLGEHAAALETLDALEAAHADYARLYQERGHVLAAMERPAEALAAYRAATRLNPALLASWRAILGLAGRTTVEPELLHEARVQVDALNRLPPEILGARSMFHEGRVLRAEAICRDFLQREPRHVEAMRLLAALGMHHGILDDAEFILESAVVFEPDNPLPRLDYVNVLYRRQQFGRALEEAETLHAQLPENASVRATLANQCVAVGDFARGIALYRELLDERPSDAGLHLTLGHALKTVGDTDAAIDEYRAAYRERGDFGDAYWSLANLKTYRFSEDELAAMGTALEADGTAVEDRIHLHFALGKSLEDARAYADSFTHYASGNALRRESLGYDAERMSRRLARQREHCSPALLSRRRGQGCPAPDPIFIVGLPRAGSTLLEQILSSHSQVDGTMELNHITALAQKIDGRRGPDDPPRYPAELATLPASTLRAMGERFLEETRVHRRGAPFFIDKMPNNFRHIGLIHLILPNARIIDARRDAMACCFSNFKQLFASGQEFSYGLDDLAQYYRDYLDLMAHWQAALPDDRLLRVQHEDVLADLEGQVRRLLEFLGLPFEEGCLRYWETERAVRTPSSEQVRQPIYRGGANQWHNYAQWLHPLRQALGEELAPAAAWPDAATQQSGQECDSHG
jgi:tetratricopeptide (TPR) repeat protein